MSHERQTFFYGATAGIDAGPHQIGATPRRLEVSLEIRPDQSLKSMVLNMPSEYTAADGRQQPARITIELTAPDIAALLQTMTAALLEFTEAKAPSQTRPAMWRRAVNQSIGALMLTANMPVADLTPKSRPEDRT